MPRSEQTPTNTVRHLREWCRFDHRLALMLLAAMLDSATPDELDKMFLFAAEWRNATKELQVEEFNKAAERYGF